MTLSGEGVLVMWSGGIDSTYVLTRLLHESEQPLYAHHVQITNATQRHPKEAGAVDALFPRLRGIRDFHLSTSAVDFRHLHELTHMIPFDMQVVCAHAGAFFRSMEIGAKRTVARWTIGTHKDEGHWGERWHAIEPAVAAMAWPATPGEFFLLEPLATKQEEMAYLEDRGLLDHTWYCRMPRAGEPCRKCTPCTDVAAVRG